jgi:hypothetical protein
MLAVVPYSRGIFAIYKDNSTFKKFHPYAAQFLQNLAELSFQGLATLKKILRNP